MNPHSVTQRVGVLEHLTPQDRDRLADEQLSMVWDHAFAGIVIGTVFALVFAWQIPSGLPESVILGWLALKIVVAVIRLVQGLLYRRARTPRSRGWHTWTYLLLSLDGAVWGVAGAVLVHQGLQVASIAIPALLCVAIVAAYGLQARFSATAAYVSPIIGLTAISQLSRADHYSVMWGTGLLFLLALLLMTARRYEKRLAENFLLRLEASRNEKMKDEALALAQRNAEEREHALELAQRKSAVKSQFLATMSHELRTPLHGILGVARLLHIESNDSAVQRRVELIESSGMHLLALINDLLDISRIESGQLKIAMSEFDVNAEAHRVAEIYAVRAGDKGLSFSFDCRVDGACWVVGDPSRLRQVLHNLLGNAVKFTKTGFVSMSLEQVSQDKFVFVVRDSGVGISPEDQAHIFEAFHQAGATAARHFEGTGLGLTIARELARAMEGDITCKSARDVGSTFQFEVTLKAREASVPGAAEIGNLEAPLGVGFNVLLAEDNDLNALIATAYLERLGVSVERVNNGALAVRHALREVGRPDLVLMDVLMPGLDGYAATRQIRERERSLSMQPVPIVAMTATAAEEDRQQCLSAGMNAFLPKPFSAEELQEVLRVWLTRPQPGASAIMPPPPVLH